MSAVTIFKQSVSHEKERKMHQSSPASARATPCSVLTCTAYICLMRPSALRAVLPLRPWNISCFNAHGSALNILHYAPGSAVTITTLNLPTHYHGGLRYPSLLVTCCPSPFLCLLEEDRPATTPLIPTQDYPKAHKDPKEATKIYGYL
ncbi:hypothetical protein E2C01_100321 [Portunus trituberculatus]|uniref:Uncharacterized protein n=1 Tax=Portunus trituberculatus TaxID=210409 RepID=A0A5B7KD24_PORTR|nr:hypothetical protein [Portunus trituberculatus]